MGAISQRPLFDVTLPSVPTHEAMVELIPRIVKYVGLASVPIIVSTSLLAILNIAAIAGTEWLALPILLMLFFGVGIFFTVCAVLNRTLDIVNDLHTEWKMNTSVQREVALSRVLEVTINGSKNNVSIGASQTNNSLNVGNETPAQFQIKFLRHLQEFDRTAQIRGYERSNYLLDAGASSNYKYTCDGETMSRVEYDGFMNLLKQTGRVKGRRKGRTGDVDTETKLINAPPDGDPDYVSPKRLVGD